NIKQFFILFAGVIACALFFFFFRSWLAIILSVVLLVAMVFLMFGQVQGRPAYTVILGAFKYFWLPKTFVWQKEKVGSENIYYESERRQKIKPAEPEAKQVKVLTREELKNLAGELDKKDSVKN
ncbi:TPA: hypothetical protein DEX28_01865, partial [Patescibacteria group bacterium]|nr:hypothetical protein [Patescibacteria group bacterium]